MPTLFRAAARAALALFLLALCFGAAPASPQQAGRKARLKPEIAALLHKATTAYQSLRAYHHTAIMTFVGQNPKGEKVKNELRFTLALDRPNRFCYKSDTSLEAAAVSDGKLFFNYRGDLMQYTRQEAPASFKEINIVDDVLFRPLGTYIIALMLQGDALADGMVREAFEKASVLRTVGENGKKWIVVHLPFGKRAMPYEIYFHAENFRIGRATAQIAQPRLELIETYDNIKLNAALPDTVFQFTPPGRARRVAAFPNTAMEQVTSRQFEGRRAPNFVVRNQRGEEVGLSSFRGKTVIVNFWASWSSPCKKVLPVLHELQQQHPGEVVVLNINALDQRSDAEKYLQANPAYAASAFWDADAEEHSVAHTFDLKALPTTLIIDKRGTVFKYVVGAYSPETYAELLEQLGVGEKE